MFKQPNVLVAAEEGVSSAGQLGDPFSEPSTPFSSLSVIPAHPRPSDSWDVFPWYRFPNLTISERRGRPKPWIWQHGYDL